MKNIHDVIIIGGGPAGYSAALYAARGGLDTVVIEKLSSGGQMNLTGSIDNYPGFEEGVDGFTLGVKMQESAHRFGAVTEYGEIVTATLHGDVKKVTTADGTSYFSRAVIIATGAEARELGIPKERELTGRGVHYCAHCDGRFYKGRTAVVVGGGNSAVSDALYLSGIAEKVYVVHRRDSLRSTKIYTDALLAAPNVEFLWNSTLESAVEENGRVSGAVVKSLADGSERHVKCDGIFISIGRKPQTEFLPAELLDGGGYVAAGEDTATAIPGVFVAGDVRTKSLRQVVTAVSDGAVAADEAEKYVRGRR